jgi:hypothetical protein
VSRPPRDGDLHPWDHDSGAPKISLPDAAREAPVPASPPSLGPNYYLLANDYSVRDCGQDENGILKYFDRTDKNLGYRGGGFKVSSDRPLPRPRLLPER